MAWQALVPPRKWVTDRPGWCLRYAQSFFGAPARYDSAWIAWQNQQFRHGPDEPLPDVPVLLWYSHWGMYNGVYGNWGHVTPHVPGDAIYSSPSTPVGSPAGFERYATIQQVESRFSAKYVGWSEDINTLRVAQYFNDEEDDMTPEQNAKLNAVYDALFKTTPTTRGEHAGLLRMTSAVYDAQFKETETSRGTPGGTLVNDRHMLAKLDAIIEHFGIEVDE